MPERADRHTRPIRDTRKPGVDDDDGRERKAVNDRSDAHRRWVGEDGDDGACRGID
jgi:hypothetical protein